MGQLDTSGYYALGIPAYLALMGVEALHQRRRGEPVYPIARTIGSLSTSLGAVVVGLFLGPLLVGAYDYGLEHIALIRWREGSWVVWVLAIVLSDFCYYLHHRAGHAVGALWAIHNVHHQCDRFDLSIAMRHPWLSDLYAIPFYALMPLLGVPAFEFFVGISLVSFYALTIHTPMMARPSLFGLLVTPGTHIVHHAKNPRYLGNNLGAMFTLWDRLFGTHVEVDPADPPELGTPRGYETHDGVKAQWVAWSDLWHVSRRGRTWRERLTPFFARPGWRPAGVKARATRAPRPDAALSPRLAAYVVAQFGVVLSVAAYVLWFRDRHGALFLVVAAGWILLSLSALGGLLDGRRSAAVVEAARLLCLPAVALV